MLVVVCDAVQRLNFVSFLSFQTRKQHRSVSFPEKITQIQVIMDATESAEREGMRSGLESFPHMVLVGGENSYVALFHLGRVCTAAPDSELLPPAKCVTLLSEFCLRKSTVPMFRSQRTRIHRLLGRQHVGTLQER